MIQCSAVQLHFIQCPFPNQIQFGLEKNLQKVDANFQTKSSLVWKLIVLILWDKNSKPNPVWFGKKWWNFRRKKFQIKFRLVWNFFWKACPSSESRFSHLQFSDICHLCFFYFQAQLSVGRSYLRTNFCAAELTRLSHLLSFCKQRPESESETGQKFTGEVIFE